MGNRWQLADKMKPSVVIPMHYAAPGIDMEKFPLLDLSSFTSEYRKVIYHRSKDVEITGEILPPDTRIWALTPQVI